MRDATRMILLVKGDGCLGPSESRRGGEGVNGVHLLLGDAALPVGLICLGAPEDQESSMDMNLNNNACKYTNIYSRGKNGDF